MIERMTILSMWVAAMSGVVGILSSMCGCDAVAMAMAYVGGAGYTAAAACGWRIVSRGRRCDA